MQIATFIHAHLRPAVITTPGYWSSNHEATTVLSLSQFFSFSPCSLCSSLSLSLTLSSF